MFYVFHHIPKAAGTACVDALHRRLNVVPDYHKNTDEDALKEYESKRIDLKSLGNSDILSGHYNLSGHYLYQRYPSLDQLGARKVAFFRDPLETALSGVRFGITRGRFNKAGANTVLLKRVGYISRMLECDANNYRAVIDSYFFVGLVETIQQSMDAFMQLAGKEMVEVPKKNITAKVEDAIFNEGAVAEFQSKNTLDQAIYDYAKVRAQRLIEEIR